MKLVLVCGPWCAGTSAAAGLLARLGARGFGPYFPIWDGRWSCTYELLAFRDAVLPFLEQETQSLKAGIVGSQVVPSLVRLRARIENQEFGPYDKASPRPIFLKHALSAVLLAEICSVFDTKIVHVLRPLEDIERTRQRRGWKAHFGEQGARVIYSRMSGFPVEQTVPVMSLSYPELLKDPAVFAAELSKFAELGADPATIQKAAAFIKVPVHPDRISSHSPSPRR